jgi:hypothetical protein
MTRLLIAFTFIIVTATNACSQNIEPLDLAHKIFGKEKFTMLNNYITGEYIGQPNGQDIGEGAIKKFSLLGQTENKAVVAMTILDSSGQGLDTYLHFVKDTVWKMEAFRALAQTGIIEQVVLELEKMSPQQVDSIVNKSKKDKKNKEYAIFTSREDYDFQLGNSKLTLALDDEIIKHFLDNKPEFERIKDSALKELKNKKSDERGVKLVEKLKPEYQKLFISSVSYGDYDLGLCLNFLIGGILDNTVGYIYVKDKKDLPKMDADSIIMIREIGGGWYIYKTT